MRFGIVGAVVLIAGYVATIVLYAGTGLGRPHPLLDGEPLADGTTVIMDIEELQSVKGTLVANLTVAPGPQLLDPVTHSLTENLTVAITSAVTPTKRTWPAGTAPGVFPVPLMISGNPSDWPFDSYRTGPVMVELFRGEAAPARAPVTFVDRIPGWRVRIADDAVSEQGHRPSPYRVELRRSPSTAAFATVVVGVMITLAGLALFVAIATVRRRRKFQPPMMTWYAALLFAVVPLRNALPDPPPIGFWIDVTVVLWVIVGLVFAMTLYTYCWWRDTKTDERSRDP